MQDIIDNDVCYMPIGKLDHLTVGTRYKTVEELMMPTTVHGYTCEKKYRDSGKELFLFEAKDSPVKITSISADAIYKRELLVEKLEEMDSFSMTHPERITLPDDMVPKSIEDFKHLLIDLSEKVEALSLQLKNQNSITEFISENDAVILLGVSKVTLNSWRKLGLML